MRCFAWCLVLMVAAGVLGCGKRLTEAERLKLLVPNAASTTKISGKVTVDGKPIAKEIWVTLHPAEGNTNTDLRPTGQTDARGYFQIGTYAGVDGAPKGDWKITIEWLTFQKRGSEWVGPDKLNNQYNDPKKTPFQVTVADKPIELPPFELSMQGSPAGGGK